MISRAKIFIRYTALIAWGAWAIGSTFFLFYKNADFDFIITYLFYLLFAGFLMWVSRHDLLSPLGLIVLNGFIAFGLNLPLFYGENRNIVTSDYTSMTITDGMLSKVLIVFLITTTGFVLGYYSLLHKYYPIKKLILIKSTSRKVTPLSFLIIFVILVAACIIRKTFHLGEAGAQPTIPYAGYLQYILYDGVLLLAIWYTAQALRQGKLYIVLGLILLLSMAISQALLSWRGGVIQIIYVTAGLFWYQVNRHQKKPPVSLAWLVILLLSANFVIELGNQVRTADEVGGQQHFAKSMGNFIESVIYRGQGTTRLAGVVDYFGDLTIFNHFFIVDLISQQESATHYIDRKLYAVGPKQSHSVGASGPGGPYMGMGMVGVFLGYFLLGAFYRSAYKNIFVDRDNNILAIVLYSYLVFSLTGVLSENFGMGFIKNLIALFFEIYLLRFLITKKTSRAPAK
jgi:oligosaccharide repeat unit polymerase